VDYPRDDDYAVFEHTVHPWTKEHLHPLSAVFGRMEAAPRYWAEQMRQDVVFYSRHAHKQKDAGRLTHKPMHDQSECRAMHWNFYPCVRVDTLTAVMERWNQPKAPAKEL